MNQLSDLKIAIVYDRVNKFGGAERVLLTLHEMFPDAPLYTSVYDSKKAPWASIFPKIHTSFLQKIPILKNHHELMGWLMPIAFESFNFSEYDIVISITSEAAKGIITGTNTLHVCYMLTPTRYLWSGKEFYLNNPPKIFKIFPFYKIVSWPFLTYAKWWDKVAAQRPDKIIAISTEVCKRIRKYYNRDSEIIFPPVNIPEVALVNHPRGGIYYFIHGRFEPYKRLDLVIDTFNDLGLPLVVSGSGSEFDLYKSKICKNIRFIFNPTDNELSKLYSNAKAFLMPQEEDFGITSMEAQSFGVPVIAYRKGGALDTVIENKTGVFFNHQNKESLKQAIAKFDKIVFNHKYLTNNVKNFSKENFKRRLQRSLVRSISSRWWRDTSLASI
ncbi:MAG: glycosyltransferase [Candidatus Woesebacteria bacterium]|nr:glycosyltransferase [Candidatus Woesebacteria bacterium]